MKLISILIITVFLIGCTSSNLKTKKINFTKPDINKYNKTIKIVSRSNDAKVKCFNYETGEPKAMRGFYMTKDTLSHYNVLETDYDFLNDQIDIYQGMDILLEKPSNNNYLLYTISFLSGVAITGLSILLIK